MVRSIISLGVFVLAATCFSEIQNFEVYGSVDPDRRSLEPVIISFLFF